MCGIAGIISPRPDGQNWQRLRGMLEQMVARGPDNEGVWNNQGCWLGHRRLSIIDLSDSANQPMVSPDGSVALVFNGEIYNYLELRQELRELGVTFRSTSDTEVILHGYILWGKAILERIKGFFALAIYDKRDGKIVLAKDPFGKKPLYYSLNGDEFIFASDLKALASSLPRKPEIDYEGLPHYLSRGYFKPGRTVYQNIFNLKAGSTLSFDIGSANLNPEDALHPILFDFSSENPGNPDDVISKVQYLLKKSVERRLRADVPVGVFLSGGIDSSLVSLIASESSTTQIHAYTAFFEDGEFNESQYADQVAAKAKIAHHKVGVTMEDMPRILQALAGAYAEPFGDDSSIPTFALFQAVKGRTKVILTGDGADEVFGGYKITKLFKCRAQLATLGGLGDLIPRSLASILLGARGSLLKKIATLIYLFRSDVFDAFDELHRGGWNARMRQSALRPEMWEKTGKDNLEHELRKEFFGAGQNDLERYLNMSLQRLVYCYLVKVDRASMTHSIEARSPFLDIDLFRFVSRLPLNRLLPGPHTKPILKELLARRMGEAFVKRAKMGFSPPLSSWMKKPLSAQWMRDNLCRPESLAYKLFKPGDIGSMVENHKKGFDHTGHLWKLLFLNEWHRQTHE